MAGFLFSFNFFLFGSFFFFFSCCFRKFQLEIFFFSLSLLLFFFSLLLLLLLGFGVDRSRRWKKVRNATDRCAHLQPAYLLSITHLCHIFFSIFFYLLGIWDISSSSSSSSSDHFTTTTRGLIFFLSSSSSSSSHFFLYWPSLNRPIINDSN